MKKDSRKNIVSIAKTVNYLYIAFLFAFLWFDHYNEILNIELSTRFGFVLIIAYLLTYNFLIRTFDGFALGISKALELVYSQCLAAFILDGAIFVTIWFLLESVPSLMPIIFVFAVKCISAFIWAYLFDYLYFRNYIPKRVAVIYFDKRDYDRLWTLEALSRKFRVEKSLRVTNVIDNQILTQLENMDAVFVRGLPANKRNDILKFCMEKDIEVYFWPKIGDVLIAGAEKTHMFHVPVMYLQRYRPKSSYLLVKRVFDILVSLLGIVLLSPFMLITMYAIRFYDGGPVLYKQVRLTKDEREFKIWKFRSMKMDAEKDGVARLSTGIKDSRITPVGRVIRAIRFDELPQLFNILKGDMSIVGPRPERPEIAQQYAMEMPEFKLRLQAKAGLTGYAQVYGKYNSLPYDKLQMDLLYLTNPSFLNDIRIMLATVKILFMKESTEGVPEGQITA